MALVISRNMKLSAAVVLALLLAGCSSDPSPAVVSPTSPSTKGMGLTTPELSPHSFATVESVVDARTISLTNGNKLRVVGLAAPDECWEGAAVEFAKSMLVGKQVKYTRVSDELATLQLTDDSDYALLAVGQGALRAESFEVDVMREAQESAEKAKLGLWGAPCEGRDTTPTSTAPRPSAQPAAPVAPPQPRPATSVRPPAPPPNGCTITYRVVKRWKDGYEASTEVRNDNTTPIKGWTLNWTLTNGERLDRIWNAEAPQKGTQITAKNTRHNRTIAAGGSVSLRYAVKSGRSSTTPRSFKLNGMTCTIK